MENENSLHKLDITYIWRTYIRLTSSLLRSRKQVRGASKPKKFVTELGPRLTERGGDPRAQFLIQRISLAIQRENAASLMGKFRRSARDGDQLKI